MPNKLPGTALAAIILAVLTAIFVAIVYFPSGLLWASAYMLGTVGLVRLERWAYWLLIATVAASWILDALQGRFGVISFGLVLVVLLLTPSARAAVFGPNRSLRNSQPVERPPQATDTHERPN